MRSIHMGIPYSVVSLIAIFVMLISIGCEPVIPFEVANQTDEALLIYIGYNLLGEVAPGETAKMTWVQSGRTYPFLAKNRQGKIIYAENMTVSKLIGRHVISKPAK